MKITKDNYYSLIEGVQVPDKYKIGYDYVNKITNNGESWEDYDDTQYPKIKATIDGYFEAIEPFLMPAAKEKTENKLKIVAHDKTEHKAVEPAGKFTQQAKAAARDLIEASVLRGDTYEELKNSRLGTMKAAYSAEIVGKNISVTKVNGTKVLEKFSLQNIYNEILSNARRPLPDTKPHTHEKKTAKQEKIKFPEEETPVPVEKTSDEVRFIKRFIMLKDKTKTKEQILNFINSLQRAILERRIRKTSKHGSEISEVQKFLIGLYDKMKGSTPVKIAESLWEKLKKIGYSETPMLAIAFMKRYVALHGRTGIKTKAHKLFVDLEKAVKTGKINREDKYAQVLNKIYLTLQNFVYKGDGEGELVIAPAELNGLNGILGCAGDPGCGCGMDGVEESDTKITPLKNRVMNSMDFAKLSFATLGFFGKWLKLIGDPCKGFTAMVFGKPKTGKSYLCIDFAGYLAKNFGPVLYVAKEEKLDATLQTKLEDKAVCDPDLYVSDIMPDSLSAYDFVFLDSVNKLGYTPEQLNKLKEQNPNTSFIYVFQTTKAGSARGTNEFQHDVDIVIEIPEKGKAVQYGRFNQGGEMNIFDEEEPRIAA